MIKEEETKNCETCIFNMPNNKNEFVCTGAEGKYGQPTPIKNINYEECWEEIPDI